MKEMQVQSLAVKIPWRRKWQPTPVYLPEKSYAQRSLVGYSPKGYKRVKHDLTTKQQQNNLYLCLCTFSIQQPSLTHPKPNLMIPTLYTQHTHRQNLVPLNFSNIYLPLLSSLLVLLSFVDLVFGWTVQGLFL